MEGLITHRSCVFFTCEGIEMSRIFFSTSIKGGVGKTALAALVADTIQLYAPGDNLRCFSPRAEELTEYVDNGVGVEGRNLDTIGAIGAAVESVGDDWGVFDFVPSSHRRVLELAPDIIAAYPHVHILYNVGDETLLPAETIAMLAGIKENVTMCYVEPEPCEKPLKFMIPSLAAWHGDVLGIPRLNRVFGHVEMMNKRSIPLAQRMVIQNWKHRAISSIRDHFNIHSEVTEV